MRDSNPFALYEKPEQVEATAAIKAVIIMGLQSSITITGKQLAQDFVTPVICKYAEVGAYDSASREEIANFVEATYLKSEAFIAEFYDWM